MRFLVVKSSLDGVCGGNRLMPLADVLSEVRFHKNYRNVEEMHDAIRRWAAEAKLGSVFTTSASVIICSGDRQPDAHECFSCLSEKLTYGEISPVENGSIVQEGRCDACGYCWKDIFVFSERHELAGVSFA